MHDRKKVREELLADEFRALANICLALVAPAGARTRNQKIDREDKARAFRRAVMSGMGSGKAERVPHDLVEDEYRLALEGLQSVKKEPKGRDGWLELLSELTVEYRMKIGCESELVIRRPFPWRPLLNRNAFNIGGSWNASAVAAGVTAARFSLAPASMPSYLYRREEREVVEPYQKLLGSLYLDVASFRKVTEAQKLRERLYDALCASNYPKMKRYYIVLLAHNLQEDFTRSYCAVEINKLCDAVLRQRRNLVPVQSSEK